MRYLRHAPLAFWLTLTLGLATIAGLSWYAGKDTSVTVTPMVSTGETRTDVRAMLERVSGVYPAITTLDIAVWAAETAHMADDGLARHLTAGGAENDAVSRAWVDVAAEARALASDGAQDSSAALVGAARLGQAVQRLAAVVDGLTVGPVQRGSTGSPVSSAAGSGQGAPTEQTTTKGQE